MYEQRTGGREWESNPPKDRLAALPGFEVRTPHQGRFPSIATRSNTYRQPNRERSSNEKAFGHKLDTSGSYDVPPSAVAESVAITSAALLIRFACPLGIDAQERRRIIANARGNDVNRNPCVKQHRRTGAAQVV